MKTGLDLGINMDKDLKIQTLEAELKEAQLKIERICNWIQLNHDIIVPADVLDLDTDTNTKQDFDDFFQVIPKEPSPVPEFCNNTNDWINSDFENKNEDFKDHIKIISCTTSSSNSTSLDSVSCKPCFVVLPRIIQDFNDQNDPAPALNKRRKLGFKLIPSQDQRAQALTIYKNYRETKGYDGHTITCPICQSTLNSYRSTKSGFKKHLLRLHYFTQEEFQNFQVSCGTSISTSVSTSVVKFKYPVKRTKLKSMPSQEQRTRALTIYHNYIRTTSDPSIQCPICDSTFTSYKSIKSTFKRHLLKLHYFTREEIEGSYHSHVTSIVNIKETTDSNKRKRKRKIKKIKIKPTEEERQQVKDMFRDYIYDCDEDSIIKCPINSCGKTWQYKGNGMLTRSVFRRHLVRVHFFTKEELLINNLSIESTSKSTDTGKKKKHITCHICGKFFKFRTSLLAHIKLVHEGERPANYRDFLCHICNAKYSTNSGLQNHFQTKHQEEKKFLCSYCPQAFYVKGNLKVHTRTHTGEKPYKCDICNTQFANHSSIYMHKVRHHYSAEERDKLKTYLCDKCPSVKFRLISQLKFHQETVHDNIRRYSCPKPDCGMRFKCSSNLNNHIRTHDNPNRGYRTNRGYRNRQPK